MAELSELVRIKKRMCNKFGRNKCKGCPLLHQGCVIIAILGHSDFEFKELEETLLSWAAEHQEPVYPAWRDWLRSQYPMMGPYTMTDILELPIPADIAQKLGIEPKEIV